MTGIRSRFASALAAEAMKIAGGRAWLFALAAVAGLSSAAALAYRFIEEPRDPGTIHNGFGCLAYSASIGVWAGAFAVVIHASLLVSQERGWGTLSYSLTRPVGRTGFFAAKALLLVIAPLLVLAAAVVPAAALSAAFYGFGDVVEKIPYGSDFLLWRHHGRNFMANRVFLATALAFPPLVAAACMGFLFSNVFTKPAASLGSAVFAYFILEFVVRRLWEDLGRFLFTTWATRFFETVNEFARGISTASLERKDIALSLAVSASFSIFSVSASFILFRRRDIG